MRILYILPFIPWPVKVRSSNLIPRLAERHEVHLVCLEDGKEENPNLEWLSKICRSVRIIPHSKIRAFTQSMISLPTTVPLRLAYCYNPQMKRVVEEAIRAGKADVIYIERWRALQYVPRDCGIPVLCDPTDSMSLYNRRLLQAGTWWEKLVGFEEYIKFVRHEAVLARRADISVFCSRVDLDVVRKLAPEAKYGIIPNGVDCDLFALKDESEEEPDTIVFTGNFSYRPNQHAIEFFLTKILPRVRQHVPVAKFLAVGRGANAFFAGREHVAGVEVHDFVPQLRPYIARAAVAVAPITVGTGVSNKLLEAFSTGTPIVSTRMACGDLPVMDGVHLFIADEAQQFADKLTLLLTNASLRRNLRANGRRLVEENYAWESVTRHLEEMLIGLLPKKESGSEFEFAEQRRRSASAAHNA